VEGSLGLSLTAGHSTCTATAATGVDDVREGIERSGIDLPGLRADDGRTVVLDERTSRSAASMRPWSSLATTRIRSAPSASRRHATLPGSSSLSPPAAMSPPIVPSQSPEQRHATARGRENRLTGSAVPARGVLVVQGRRV
jgi:hypothetical protein